MRVKLITLAAVVALVCVPTGAAGHNQSYQNAMKMKSGLAWFNNSRPIPLVLHYWAMEAAGRKYNVNPALIAGIAAKESQLGRTRCLAYEAWGLGACGRAWSPPEFTSWHQSIFYFAGYLRVRFLNHGITSVRGILAGGYCAGCPTWADDVTSWMSPFHMGYGVTYPR